MGPSRAPVGAALVRGECPHSLSEVPARPATLGAPIQAHPGCSVTLTARQESHAAASAVTMALQMQAIREGAGTVSSPRLTGPVAACLAAGHGAAAQQTRGCAESRLQSSRSC